MIIDIDKVAAICDALVSITAHECCNYCFDKEVGDAIQFLNDYETECNEELNDDKTTIL